METMGKKKYNKWKKLETERMKGKEMKENKGEVTAKRTEARFEWRRKTKENGE